MDNLRGTGRTYRQLEHCVEGMLKGNKIMFVLAGEIEVKRSVRMVLTILEKLGIRANVDGDRVSITEKGFIQFGGFSNTLKDMKNGRFNGMPLEFITDHFADECGVFSSQDYENFNIYTRLLSGKSDNYKACCKFGDISTDLKTVYLYGDWDIPENG